ncbi:tryptophan--tRNA ligase [Candidatus Woesearchaeota archaeon]|nr:tryptophan--tRNA ligase [Candidatus Woesearchaeota archaeon]
MAQEQTVTPWEVKGDIDYGRLIREFGTEPLSESLLKRIQKHTKELHPYLRRKIFFCHRDLNWLLDEYEKGNPFFLYTGRGPSENVHLGHITVWKFTKWLQDKFDAELWFQMTDDEKFLFKDNLELEQTNRLAYENALDVIALGFDPKKTKIFSNIDYAKTLYRQALKVAKKLTFSTVKSTFGFTDSNNVGEIFYTSMQSVPCFLPSALKGKNIPCLIPLAIDQDAHFRITRDIMPKLGYYKPALIHQRFLPSLAGSGKMSASEGVQIWTTDGPEEVAKKIRKYAFSGGADTVEEHRKNGGNPEIDASYQWLTFFEEDDKKLEKIYHDYKSGKLLSGELKQILIDTLNVFLKEHQAKREKARKVLDKFILKD